MGVKTAFFDSLIHLFATKGGVNCVHRTEHLNQTGITLSELISAKTLSGVDQIRERFQAAIPFPHVVIDDFLKPRFADDLVADFPQKDDSYNKFSIGEDGKVSPNYANHDVAQFPKAFQLLDRLMKDSGFLSLLSEMTGIPTLEYDPDYAGGGIRESSGGTFLPPHVDFNHHPSRLVHRRLNLLLYLNENWLHEWGGNLEVHRDPRANRDSLVNSYTPLFNRCLIFETSEVSWHGFDRLQSPPGRARRAFTIYFYTKDRPGAENIEWHSTEYVEPPLPSHLVTGHTLTQRDIELLQEAYARRDGRIAMLYALRRQADTRYTELWHHYEYYLNAWKEATGKS